MRENPVSFPCVLSQLQSPPVYNPHNNDMMIISIVIWHYLLPRDWETLPKGQYFPIHSPGQISETHVWKILTCFCNDADRHNVDVCRQAKCQCLRTRPSRFLSAEDFSQMQNPRSWENSWASGGVFSNTCLLSAVYEFNNYLVD